MVKLPALQERHRGPVVGHPEKNVVEGGKSADKGIRLVDARSLPAMPQQSARCAQIPELAIDHGALVWHPPAVQNTQQRGFARAGHTNEDSDRSTRNGQVDAEQYGGSTAPHFDVLESDRRIARHWLW